MINFKNLDYFVSIHDLKLFAQETKKYKNNDIKIVYIINLVEKTEKKLKFSFMNINGKSNFVTLTKANSSSDKMKSLMFAFNVWSDLRLIETGRKILFFTEMDSKNKKVLNIRELSVELKPYYAD